VCLSAPPFYYFLLMVVKSRFLYMSAIVPRSCLMSHLLFLLRSYAHNVAVSLPCICPHPPGFAHPSQPPPSPSDAQLFFPRAASLRNLPPSAIQQYFRPELTPPVFAPAVLHPAVSFLLVFLHISTGQAYAPQPPNFLTSLTVHHVPLRSPS